MSHHSSEFDPEREAAVREMMGKIFGEYPDGKLNEHDAGAIAMAVVTENGRVKLVFPKLVSWVGFTADEAIGLAELIIKHARNCGSKKPLQLHIG